MLSNNNKSYFWPRVAVAAPMGARVHARGPGDAANGQLFRIAGGNGPTLDAREIDDLVAFLCTLTDGFDPKNPSAYNVPAQCQPITSP